MADPPPNKPPPTSTPTPAASWTRLAAEEAAEAAASAANPAQPKPFSPPPPGWSPPSLSELWGYANRRHPYARLGYGGAVLMSVLMWSLAGSQKKGEEKKKEGE